MRVGIPSLNAHNGGCGGWTKGSGLLLPEPSVGSLLDVA